jgi:NDP-sugar pyrophosphorylase family protein
VEDTERYGPVLTKDGKVLSFKEKGNSAPGWINNGHYIFKKEAFHGLSGAFSVEKDVFPKLVEKWELGAFKVENDHFIDMGIPEDYEKLCSMYEAVN